MQSHDIRVDDTEEKVSLQYQENLTLFEGGRDDIQLQLLGKKPVLKASKIRDNHQNSTCSNFIQRNWGALSVLGLACSILGTWEGTFVLSLTKSAPTSSSPSTYNLVNANSGGSAGAVYGFIFVWIGTACYFVVLAELASM
ncbi:unnamed protein product [Penicillium pancosmium]